MEQAGSVPEHIEVAETAMLKLFDDIKRITASSLAEVLTEQPGLANAVSSPGANEAEMPPAMKRSASDTSLAASPKHGAKKPAISGAAGNAVGAKGTQAAKVLRFASGTPVVQTLLGCESALQQDAPVKLKLATANVGSLKDARGKDGFVVDSGQTQLLEMSFDRIKLDVIGVQEGRTRADQERHGLIYEMFISGANYRG
jgi:hypothetical protein